MNKEQRMRCTINCAREQGLEMSDKDLIETLFSQSSTEEDNTEDENEMVRTITNKRCNRKEGARYGYDSKQYPDPKKESQIEKHARSLEQIIGDEDSVSDREEDDVNNSKIHSDSKKNGWVEKSRAMKKGNRSVVGKAWSQLCSSSHKPKRKKRKAKYLWQAKEKKMMENKWKLIHRLNDLTRPMPKIFWEGGTTK